MNKQTRSNSIQTFTPFKVVVYSLLPVLVLFGGVEGCARLLEYWRPPMTLDYGWGFTEDSLVFEPSGVFRDRMATRLEKLVSLPKQSFALPKSPDTFRILIMGGSNVNYMGHNLDKMVARLNAASRSGLHFEVINCGGLAYGSHRLAIMARELVRYEPDVLLLYTGHNEFEELLHEQLTATGNVAVQRVAYSLATLRLLRDMLASIHLACVDIEQLRETQPPEVDSLAAGSHQFSAEEIDARMDGFRENLAGIISLFQEHEVPVVISTVASNYWAPDIHYSHAEVKEEVQRLYEAGNYEEGMRLARDILSRTKRHQASDAENTIIRELADRFALPLVDGEKLIMKAEPNGVPGERYLSDRCHLTPEGRDMVVAAFEREIRRLADMAP